MAGPRVLVVDEDEDVLDVTREFLAETDPALEIATATSVPEALETVGAEPVDVVVTDYRLPDRNGIELAEAARQRADDLACLLYTAAPTESIDRADAVAGVVRKRTGREQYRELASLIREVS